MYEFVRLAGNGNDFLQTAKTEAFRRLVRSHWRIPAKTAAGRDGFAQCANSLVCHVPGNRVGGRPRHIVDFQALWYKEPGLAFRGWARQSWAEGSPPYLFSEGGWKGPAQSLRGQPFIQRRGVQDRCSLQKVPSLPDSRHVLRFRALGYQVFEGRSNRHRYRIRRRS